jgi:hypothetical protein
MTMMSTTMEMRATIPNSRKEMGMIDPSTARTREQMTDQIVMDRIDPKKVLM